MPTTYHPCRFNWVPLVPRLPTLPTDIRRHCRCTRAQWRGRRKLPYLRRPRTLWHGGTGRPSSTAGCLSRREARSPRAAIALRASSRVGGRSHRAAAACTPMRNPQCGTDGLPIPCRCGAGNTVFACCTQPAERTSADDEIVRIVLTVGYHHC